MAMSLRTSRSSSLDTVVGDEPMVPSKRTIIDPKEYQQLVECAHSAAR